MGMTTAAVLASIIWVSTPQALHAIDPLIVLFNDLRVPKVHFCSNEDVLQ